MIVGLILPDSICTNHILTVFLPMMSFIRSLKDWFGVESNIETENTLLQIFDSASGENKNLKKIDTDE